MKMVKLLSLYLFLIGSVNGQYFFVADKTPASEIADSIAEEYSVSIVLADGLGEKLITGRIYSETLQESLDVLSFFLETSITRSKNGEIYKIGQNEQEIIASMPGYGLSEDVQGVLGNQSALLGGNIIMKGTQTEIEQTVQALKVLGDRPFANVSLLVIETTSVQYDRVNTLLERFSVTGGLQGNNSIIGQGKTIPIGSMYDLDIAFVSRFLTDNKAGKVRIHQESGVLSGSEVNFQSGVVIPEITYTRQPETNNDLITNINRRNAGLSVILQGDAFDNKWHLALNYTDTRLGIDEYKTTFQTEAILTPSPNYVFIGGFSRSVTDSIESSVPGLRKISRLFRKKAGTNTNIEIIIMLRLNP